MSVLSGSRRAPPGRSPCPVLRRGRPSIQRGLRRSPPLRAAPSAAETGGGHRCCPVRFSRCGSSSAAPRGHRRRVPVHMRPSGGCGCPQPGGERQDVGGHGEPLSPPGRVCSRSPRHKRHPGVAGGMGGAVVNSLLPLPPPSLMQPPSRSPPSPPLAHICLQGRSCRRQHSGGKKSMSEMSSGVGHGARPPAYPPPAGIPPLSIHPSGAGVEAGRERWNAATTAQALSPLLPPLRPLPFAAAAAIAAAAFITALIVLPLHPHPNAALLPSPPPPLLISAAVSARLVHSAAEPCPALPAPSPPHSNNIFTRRYDYSNSMPYRKCAKP